MMDDAQQHASAARISASEETLRELRTLAAEHAGPDSDLRRAGFDELADRLVALVDVFEGDHIEFGREEQRRRGPEGSEEEGVG
jgi:hypothetical protein